MTDGRAATTLAKTAFIIAGYVVAFLVATGAVWLHQLATARDSVGSDGMYAFGEVLLFLVVFGVLALVPTGAALYFLRASTTLWGALSAMALAIAITSPIALAFYVAPRWAVFAGLPAVFTVLAVLRLFVSPLLLAGFVAFGVIARGPPRRRLLIASVIEAVACAAFVVLWLVARG